MRFKRMAAIILAMASVAAITTTRGTRAAEPVINLKVDGYFTAFRTKAQMSNGSIMMAMRELAGYADALVSWKDSTQTATITKGSTELVLTVGTKRAYLNKVEVEMPASPMYNNGMVMEDILVPMRFVAESFGLKIEWEQKATTVVMTTGKNPLNIMDINQPSTTNAIVLNYDEALKDAYAANSSLLNLQESIDVINESHGDLLDQINLLGSFIDLDSQQFNDALRNLRKLEDSIADIPYNEQMVRESTEYVLRNTLSSIATDEMDLQILKENILIQASNVKNAQLKLGLGVVSANAVKTLEQELAQSEVNQEVLELKIADERSSLGKILLLPMDREIIIKFEPKVENQTQNLNALVANVVNDPTLKLKETAIKEAEYAIETYTDTMTESKLAKETALAQASRSYDDTKRALEAAVRAAYSKITQIQQNQKSLEISLNKARDAYKSITTNYQAGLVTMYELDAGKAAILKAETDISKNAYTYWTLSFGLAHPYLMVNSAAGAAS